MLKAIFLKEIRWDGIPADFKDLWLFRKDVDIKDNKEENSENNIKNEDIKRMCIRYLI